MYYIAICDDEELFAEKLKQMVNGYFSNIGSECQIDVYGAGEELIKNLSEPFPYQIIFLDINMKQMDGIETAVLLRRYSEMTVLIFVTAYIRYTMEGYKVEALRYILKDDVNIKELLNESLDAACKKISFKNFSVRIPFSDGVFAVDKRKIIYIECARHKVVFYIKTGEELIQRGMRATMDEALRYMDADAVRIHQSFVVNLAYCKKVYYDHITLTNGMELPVSRRYAKEVKERFHKKRGEF